MKPRSLCMCLMRRVARVRFTIVFLAWVEMGGLGVVLEEFGWLEEPGLADAGLVVDALDAAL